MELIFPRLLRTARQASVSHTALIGSIRLAFQRHPSLGSVLAVHVPYTLPVMMERLDWLWKYDPDSLSGWSSNHGPPYRPPRRDG